MTDKEKFYKICHNILDNRTDVISGCKDKDLLVYYKPHFLGDSLYLYYEPLNQDLKFSICLNKSNHTMEYPTVGIWYPDITRTQNTTVDTIISFIKSVGFNCLLEGVEE